MSDLETFKDELAAVVDGDAAALERFADLLADSDEARDLRHEASRAAEKVREAGADFEMPADLEARVLAAIDAVAHPEATPAEPAAGQTEVSGFAPTGAMPVTESPHVAEPVAAAKSPSIPEADARWAGGKTAPPAESQAPQTASSSADTQVDAAPTPITKKRPRAPMIFGGVVLAAAASVGLYFGIDAMNGDTSETVAAGDGLTGTLARVARSADDQVSGVSLDGAPMGEGQAIAAGSTIVTDARSRARIDLSDGSQIVVDQDSAVVIGANGRSVNLQRGQLLAEVAHLENGPLATYETPSGVVQVLGTKFLLTASDDRASVRVTRGAVRVHANGESVEVKTGQEGLMRAGGNPHVVPAVDLAGSVAWSELDPNQADDVPVPGIGELRAHKPGEREDSERPLTLAHHRVSVRIVGNVARTEIEETFRNDSTDELEGVYRFPLPPDARIASLGLEVDGRWEQGAFVAKDRAQQIWRGVIRNATPESQRQQEEFIWVPGPWHDPALLEWQQGGRFELRIFPIGAQSERRVRISYEQTIAPHGEGRRYVYPLAHAEDESTRVGHFEVDMRIAGDAQPKARGYEMTRETERTGSATAERMRFSAQNFRPSGDLVVDYQTPGDDAEMQYWTYRGQATAAPVEQSREGDEAVIREQRRLHEDGRGYAVFALRPELPGWAAAESRDYMILVDASQSMIGERYARAQRLVEGMIGEMDRRDRVTVLACDVDCRAPDGPLAVPSSATAAAMREFLEKEDPAGASDLVASLRSALEHASRIRGQGNDRELHVVYVGDGMASVGPRHAGSLGAESEAMMAGRGSLTTVGIGQDADTNVLREMARGGAGHYVPFVPGQRTRAAALAVLETTYGVALERATIEMPSGVAEISPAQLPTIRSGQEVLVAARLDRNDVEGEVVLRGKVGGRPFEQRYPVNLTASTAAGNAFVPRLWAAATIEALDLKGQSEDTSRIVALSKGFGVMSRHTSLLVLESEAMFRAFGVDRARPTLQWTGEEDMEFGSTQGQLNALGYTGSGAGGGGVGSGRGSLGGLATGASARPARAPGRTRTASARAAGNLDDMLAGALGGADEEAPREQERRDNVGVRQGVAESAVPDATVAPVTRSSRRRGPGQWMRKIWYREGRINTGGRSTERDMEAVREAETLLRAQPDSRDRHRSLVRALSRAGELERAEEVARDWIERDRLDPEALTYLSDVVGRQGKRDLALRLLSGIVDLEPDNVTLQERMANAFERAGKAERACAHRVALAEIRPGDEDLVADAMRCERALGRSPAAERLLGRVDGDDRDDVRSASERAPTPERVRGDLLLTANWTGSSDVDLTLVTPQGTRLSWMGGRTNVVGDDAERIGRERLGLRRAGVGTYYIEVNRVDPTDRTPIRGQIEIRALDERRTIDFDLQGLNTTAGSVRVVRRWRMGR